jgi:hypothetical protein
MLDSLDSGADTILMKESDCQQYSPINDTSQAYLLRASKGDSRDAFQAGIMPAPRLNSNERIQT